jgi:cytochrome c553
MSTSDVYAASKGAAQKGRVIAETCANCHGIDSEIKIAGFPTLAGQKYKYMAKQLREMRASAKIRAGTQIFKSSDTSSLMRARRSNDFMDPFVIELSDTEIDDISAYYASLRCRAVMTALPLPAPKLENRCQICHGKRGIAKNSNIPNIAGQDALYLEQQMQAFWSAKLQKDDGQERCRSAIMEGQAAKLSDKDITDISLYYSRLPCDG